MVGRLSQIFASLRPGAPPGENRLRRRRPQRSDCDWPGHCLRAAPEPLGSYEAMRFGSGLDDAPWV